MKDIDLTAAGTVALPFLRALAHEMAAPLTTILGYAQLNLESPGSASEAEDDFTEIETSAQALRTQVEILGRLSRYLPEETHCSAKELVNDLRLLTSAVARSGGCALTWTTDPEMPDCHVQGNPWLLRMTVLAYLGSLCHRPSAEIKAGTNDDGLLLEFPLPDSDPPHPSPDTWGCAALGGQLLAHQSATIEAREENYRLLLPTLVELD